MGSPVGLTVKNNTKDMQVGDCIPCRFTATASGTPGVLSELGTCAAAEIPVTGAAIPDGLFYFIKAAKGLYIGDRIVQHTLPWDTLNAYKYIDGALYHNITSADGDGSLNYDNTKISNNQRAIVFNNEMYIMWQETDNSSINQIRVKKWDSTNSVWITADNNTSLNYDATKNAQYPTPVIYNNELYIIWIESNGTVMQIRAKKLSSGSWVTADGNAAINYNSSQNANTPATIVYNNELYVAWTENNGTAYQVRVKKWNGVAWVTADNNTSINYDATKNTYTPTLIVFNDTLVILWTEANPTYTLLRIKKMSGNTWVNFDGVGNSSINYSTTSNATNPKAIIFNNDLYITWAESFSGAQIHVYKFTASNYVYSSTDGVTGGFGINYTTSNTNATNPVLIVYNNQLYCVWQEATVASGIAQIRMKKTNGFSGGWITVDNNTSMNYDKTKNAQIPIPIIYNNKIYILFGESTTNYQIRMKKFNDICLLRSISGGNAYINPATDISSVDYLLGCFPTTNEWDKYIVNSDLNSKIVKGDNNVWNWSGISTICRDTPAIIIAANNYRTIRGNNTVLKFTNAVTSLGNTTYGFRPVLQIVDPISKASGIFY
jgi:hypothetical protein